jgi:hypothetical protein
MISASSTSHPAVARLQPHAEYTPAYIKGVRVLASSAPRWWRGNPSFTNRIVSFALAHGVDTLTVERDIANVLA